MELFVGVVIVRAEMAHIVVEVEEYGRLVCLAVEVLHVVDKAKVERVRCVDALHHGSHLVNVSAINHADCAVRCAAVRIELVKAIA